MSGLQPPNGTPNVPQTGDLGLRRHLLDLDNEKTAILRDLLCVARGLCLAEAAYVSVFLDHKEALVLRVGALPKEIPFVPLTSAIICRKIRFSRRVTCCRGRSPAWPCSWKARGITVPVRSFP